MKLLSRPVTAPDPLKELTRIVERRFADLLLFAVTSTALVLLLRTSSAFRMVDWLYVLQHLLVLGFALTRSEPLIADYSVHSTIAVAVAYVYPYAQVICLQWWPGSTAWPNGGLILTTASAVFSVVCLLTIGTQFGVRPALRGLVMRGPYRLVRHPLYLSYLIADVGYNFQLWSWGTIGLALLGWAGMLYRIVAEERVMSKDCGWSAYVAAVRYRLIPALW